MGLLAVLVFVPTALAECGPGHDPGQLGSQPFQTQSTVAPSVGPVAIAAMAIVPMVVVGAVVAAVRRAPATSAVPTSGKWVCTSTAWVWVPDQ